MGNVFSLKVKQNFFKNYRTKENIVARSVFVLRSAFRPINFGHNLKFTIKKSKNVLESTNRLKKKALLIFSLNEIHLK